MGSQRTRSIGTFLVPAVWGALTFVWAWNWRSWIDIGWGVALLGNQMLAGGWVAIAVFTWKRNRGTWPAASRVALWVFAAGLAGWFVWATLPWLAEAG